MADTLSEIYRKRKGKARPPSWIRQAIERHNAQYGPSDLTSRRHAHEQPEHEEKGAGEPHRPLQPLPWSEGSRTEPPDAGAEHREVVGVMVFEDQRHLIYEEGEREVLSYRPTGMRRNVPSWVADAIRRAESEAQAHQPAGDLSPESPPGKPSGDTLHRLRQPNVPSWIREVIDRYDPPRQQAIEALDHQRESRSGPDLHDLYKKASGQSLPSWVNESIARSMEHAPPRPEPPPEEGGETSQPQMPKEGDGGLLHEVYLQSKKGKKRTPSWIREAIDKTR